MSVAFSVVFYHIYIQGVCVCYTCVQGPPLRPLLSWAYQIYILGSAYRISVNYYTGPIVDTLLLCTL